MSLRSLSVLRRLYDTIAPAYAAVTAPISSRARRLGVQWLEVKDGETLLEIGPGPGRAFRAILSDNPSGWTEAIEPTPAMRRRTHHQAARVPHRRYRIQSGTVHSLPYPTDHFDALFSAYVFDLLSPARLSHALAEARRVVRPGGRAVFVTMGSDGSVSGGFWSAVAHAAPLLLGGSRPCNLSPTLRSVGCTVAQTATVRQGGFPSLVTKAEAPSS